MTHDEAIAAAAKAAQEARIDGQRVKFSDEYAQVIARAAIAAFLSHVEVTDAAATAAQATSGGQPFTWANACRAMLAQLAREIAPG